jgi:O-antigen/teichoic acid export membrane protein
VSSASNQATRHACSRWLSRCGISNLLSAVADPIYRSSYALIANTVGTTVLGILYWAVAAHLYNRQTVGQSSALVSALILVSTFAQLNLGSTLPRFIPLAGRSTGELITYCYAASILAGLIGGLGFVTIMPRISSQWQFLGDSEVMCDAFAIATVVWGIFALQDMVLLSLRRSAIIPAENFVYGLCKLVVLAGAAWLIPTTGIFFSWIIPLALTVPAVNWLIFRHYLSDYRLLVSCSTLRAREVVRFASVDYLGTVLSQAYGNLLPLLVLSVLGAAANGTFYIAWTIASGLGLLATNFGASLLAEGSGAPHRLAELTRGVLIRCLVITSIGAIILLLAARPVLGIYGAGYAAHASSLLGLLALGTIPSSVVVVALSLDRIGRKVGRASCTRLVLTVFVLSGSWVLVKRVGLDGVALAWGGTNVVVAFARFPTIIGAMRKPVTPLSSQFESGDVARRRRHGLHRRPHRRPWTRQGWSDSSMRPARVRQYQPAPSIAAWNDVAREGHVQPSYQFASSRLPGRYDDFNERLEINTLAVEVRQT